jgi:hypothetical protein
VQGKDGWRLSRSVAGFLDKERPVKAAQTNDKLTNEQTNTQRFVQSKQSRAARKTKMALLQI